MTRRGDWMQTVSGRQFWPLDPRADEVFIEEIAHALGNLCRYNGHTNPFLSVAEHSVHIARALALRGHDIETQLWALIHDAPEAFCSDVIRPIKPHLGGYAAIEDGLLGVIAAKLGLQLPIPGVVKRADNAIVRDEMEQAMAPPPAPWAGVPEIGLGVRLKFWTPEEARIEFLHLFHTLMEARA